MKIVSYNVNGIRAAIRKGLLDWLRAVDADVICLQETKAQPEQIPLFEFEEMGYLNYWFSAIRKGYSGTAILTKVKPDQVVMGMEIEKYDSEGRFIRADYGDLSIVSVYHPSGSSGDERQAFKMQWLDDFYDYVDNLKKARPNLIISGDYNICHKPIDIHDPIRNAKSSGFLPEEREWIGKFIDSGFIDSFRYFNEEPHKYTWWSYRANARAKNLGWRIDYHMVSRPLENKLKRALILPDAYHSDHCPLTVELDV
ncbi:MAG: exodeoxyribonuclease III [Bacteroidales bacterium]|nr:exodeoxyribonuclease III [Bacteroidales bacterium]MCF8388025.1 exodeoxyribonuclease III [Bacteroidales bacterium]MCF8398290.1 exodeoxyribonuclease III [Bacteroidales bacterium]